jgi:GH15 family glucan-1,4-alpha-glucosidase
MTSLRTEDGFAPLRAYALLSDLRATALVAQDGAVDWLALPLMDSEPVCSALLDPLLGGSIRLGPAIPYETTRRYLPGSMVLETTFTTATGIVRVTDALTFGALGALPWTELARVIDGEQGEVPLAWEVRPGRGLSVMKSPWAHQAQGQPLLLAGGRSLAVVVEGLGETSLSHESISGHASVVAGQSALLAVVGTEHQPVHVPTAAEVRTRVERTIDTWQQWSERASYHGRWEDLVLRSALAIKALTFEATGAIAAAATTSLPEQPRGKRNFDYRYAWIRDSSFALDAMSRLGLSEELHAGVSWLLAAVRQEAPALRVFYALGGEPVSSEMKQVDDVAGYRGSLPVNVGNRAASQTQLGAYGHLFDAVWHYVTHGGILDTATATMLSSVADHVCDVWRMADAGLWELDSPEHYTSSKLGCWVALDRAIRLLEGDQITGPHLTRWRGERDRVRSWIDGNCWSDAKQSYTFYAGSEELDAAVLLMARFGFSEPGDRRLSTTIDAIVAELGVSEDVLLYRYSGQRDKEGVFLACSCWLVEALVHAGRTTAAEQLFTQFIEYVNDVGLLTEEMNPSNGELLGNLPQALTHLALINAATTLDSARVELPECN